MFKGKEYTESGKITTEYKMHLDGLDYQDAERINILNYKPEKPSAFERFINYVGTKAFGDAKHFERMDAKFSKAIGWNQPEQK